MRLLEVLSVAQLAVISGCVLIGVAFWSETGFPFDNWLSFLGSHPGKITTGATARLALRDLPASTKLAAHLDDPKVLNVHVVAHTHDDVGWLKTVEQYFYGENMTIQQACVEDILDSVVTSLLENPARTFTYVEQKFFSMWWHLQDDAVKDSVRYLVANKQLSFVNGGWCMHDEAATHYMGMIDQTTLGHRFLKKELGVIPTVGWQLDPFGHSASQASLFSSKVGFDALYFGRIDYQDLNKRHYEQECEGLWNSSKNLADTTVFWGLTGSYEGNYGAPQGYCFDIGCEDPLLIEMDNRELELAVHGLLEELRVQSDRTKGNHIMITMGSDFQYQRAHINYANLDLMISTISEMQRLNKVDIPAMFGPRFEHVNIFYSSPNYYTECKYAELKATVRSQESSSPAQQQFAPQGFSGGTGTYTVKTDDFMPYSDCEHCFWTGYFTSRSGLKKLERVSSAFLLGARQIESILDYTGKRDPFQCKNSLGDLEDASGVAQHHDGVSGTSKQHVANDYAKRLQLGIDRVSTCASRKLRRLLFGANATEYLQDLAYCQLLNETRCDVSQEATRQNGTDVYVVVYNGLAQTRSSIIHLPVSSKAMYSVEEIGGGNSTHTIQEVQAVPALVVSKLGGGAPYRIAFMAVKVPPLGASVYKVTIGGVSRGKGMKSQQAKAVRTSRKLSDEDEVPDVFASNEYYSVTFDGSTGKVKSMTVQNVSMRLENGWGYYTSFDKDYDGPGKPDQNPTSRDNQNSGAYIFRPSSSDQKPVILKQVSSTIYNTTIGVEVHAKFEVPWMKTVTRVMEGQPFLEIEYIVGPIPIEDGRGKEIISQLTGPIRNDGTFYTDSNGREFMERKRNYRPTWDLNVFEPIAGNYYPVNAAIYIEESSGAAIAVATDRSQGGASLRDGSLELMVQRRTLADDWRGVNEPMNETDSGMTAYPPYGNAERQGNGVVIKGKQFILIGNSGGATLARSMMDQAFVEPLVFVGSAPAETKPTFISSHINGIKEHIPPNVMLITRAVLYDEKTPTMLLRLGHQYGIGEDAILSLPVEVNLTSFLPGYEVVDVVETTLSANQEYQTWENNRLDWVGAEWEGVSSGTRKGHLPVQGTKIRLEPMDIRTFLVTVR